MKKVLIVDDSPTIRRMIRASLKDVRGIVVEEAGNGLEAIERLALGAVSLMVLDLNMPHMHGMEVLRFVRQHDLYRRTPIIVLTTKGDAETRSAAVAEGASLYLTKPFEPGILAAHAMKFLESI